MTYPFGPPDLASIFDGPDADTLALVDGSRTWTYGELNSWVEVEASHVTDRFVFSSEENSAELVVSFLACQRAGSVWVGMAPALSNEERDALRARVLAAAETPAELAAIAYTSGTSGEPKGVMHSQYSMLAPGLVSIDVSPTTIDERLGTPLSLCILNMMLLGPISAFLRGTTSVIMKRTWAEAFARDIAAGAVTDVFVVPTLVHDLVVSDAVESLAPLRSLIVGGAGVRPDLLDRFDQKFGFRPIRRYGLTEAPTGVVSDGVPLPHVDVIELDGELCIRATSDGKWAHAFTGTLGYLDDSQGTAELFRGGILHTGDTGTVSSDGTVSVSGRRSELIVRGGTNIDPREIEAVIEAAPGVVEVAVVGVDDARLGQVVGALVVGDSVDVEALDERLATKLARFKVPALILKCDALPRNAMGKVDRPAVKERLTLT